MYLPVQGFPVHTSDGSRCCVSDYWGWMTFTSSDRAILGHWEKKKVMIMIKFIEDDMSRERI